MRKSGNWAAFNGMHHGRLGGEKYSNTSIIEYVVEPTVWKTSQVLMFTFYTILRQVPESNLYGPGDDVRYSELEIEIGIAAKTSY